MHSGSSSSSSSSPASSARVLDKTPPASVCHGVSGFWLEQLNPNLFHLPDWIAIRKARRCRALLRTSESLPLRRAATPDPLVSSEAASSSTTLLPTLESRKPLAAVEWPLTCLHSQVRCIACRIVRPPLPSSLCGSIPQSISGAKAAKCSPSILCCRWASVTLSPVRLPTIASQGKVWSNKDQRWASGALCRIQEVSTSGDSSWTPRPSKKKKRTKR